MCPGSYTGAGTIPGMSDLDAPRVRLYCRCGKRLDVLTPNPFGPLTGRYGRRQVIRGERVLWSGGRAQIPGPSGDYTRGKVPNIDSVLYRYRCRGCRADWQWPAARLVAAVDTAAARRSDVDAVDV